MTAIVKRKCPRCGGNQHLWETRRDGKHVLTYWECFHCGRIDQKEEA